MAEAIVNAIRRPSMCEDALIGRDRDPPTARPDHARHIRTTAERPFHVTMGERG
jgi:hypothetical protein